MIHDHTIRSIREYIEKLSGYKYFSILKVSNLTMKKRGRLRFYYSIEITVSRAEHITLLLKSKLITNDSIISRTHSSINPSVSIFIEHDKLRDF